MSVALTEMPRGDFTGATAFWSCQADPRFSYCLYVPSGCDEARRMPLFVCVHGSFRVAESYRDKLWQFAEREGCVVLCPLFPCGADGPDDTESYKFVYWPTIRYDRVLLSMVEEAAQRVPFESDRFLLAGYSGGGQFAHRFFYGHPRRLLGVSIGAPGVVTLLAQDKPWWVGTKGLEDLVGPLDVAAMRTVPVQMVIGEADCDPEELRQRPGSVHRMPGIELTGDNRVARLDALAANFRSHDIAVEKVVVPGVAHNGFAVLDPVEDFARRCLAKANRAGGDVR